MKRFCFLLLAAMLLMPFALAEEVFFAEESLGGEAVFSEDVLFEEDAFAAEEGILFEEGALFAEETFPAEAFAETLPPEEAFTEAAPAATEADAATETTEHTAAEAEAVLSTETQPVSDVSAEREEEETVAELADRSMFLTVADYEYEYPAPEFTLLAGYYTGNPYKLKSGQVKLTWTQKDWSGKTLKKLPKGWKWYIYRAETQNGAWIQVATSTKPSITLNNQPTGYHMYIVRPEYKKGNVERYGEHSGGATNKTRGIYDETAAYIEASNLWKTIDALSVRPITKGWTDYQFIDYGVTLLDRQANLVDGSELRLKVRLYGLKGKKKTLVYPDSESDPPFKPTLTESFLNGKPCFSVDNAIVLTEALNAGIEKFELRVTPVVWKNGKITATGKTKKASFDMPNTDGRWKKIAPVITEVRQTTPNTYSVSWRHGTWDAAEEKPSYYQIYDGKKLLATVYNYDISTSSHYAFVTLGEGKHKITVYACSDDMKTRGKASTAYSLTIPKVTKQAPFISNASVKKGGGYTDTIEVSWYNANPNLASFDIIAIPQYAAIFNSNYWYMTGDASIYDNSMHYHSNVSEGSHTTTIEYIQNGMENGNRRSYIVMVVGHSIDGTEKIISDPFFLRYDSVYNRYIGEWITLKR